MPITHQSEVFYSTDELFQILVTEQSRTVTGKDLPPKADVTEEKIREFVVDRGMIRQKENGTWYLREDDLRDFFDGFSASLGVPYKYHECRST